MLTKQLKSLQHPIVKKLVNIRKDKAFREECGEVFVLGKKMVLELSKKISPNLIITTKKEPIIKGQGNTLIVTEAIMRKISGVKNPVGVAALFSLPKQKDLSNKKYLLVLDKISDPGNLGTLFRSALALGFEGAILLPSTVDPFNDKALRASKGACFFLPFCWMTKEIFLKMVRTKKIVSYLANMQGKDVRDIKYKPPLALILSNEAKGVSAWPKDFFSISILMRKSVESLNVANCGAILMFMTKNV